MTASQKQTIRAFRIIGGLALTLLVVFPTALHAQLPILDDFEDGVLDPAIWKTNLSIPQGGASVTETDGHVVLVARGYLVTVDQFDPELVGPLCVSGEWTFVTTGDADFLQILLRSDGEPDPGNCCGETTSGIEFRIQSNITGNSL